MLESRTLPGWPTAPDPSVLDFLFLTLLLPLGISAVFAFLILAPGWRRSEEA